MPLQKQINLKKYKAFKNDRLRLFVPNFAIAVTVKKIMNIITFLWQ